ncbi:hypothetical protein AVEN_32158-1 [Araneus ventricosus]|uniref:Uncharacterized protein n=1 Tax=Araneus ventricosus TaxID=182803 RepID=A0A4Y2FJ60_ARAVE|nr:hypothetical protein AVEN_32158-1 [Araneus ventricosus]
MCPLIRKITFVVPPGETKTRKLSEAASHPRGDLVKLILNHKKKPCPASSYRSDWGALNDSATANSRRLIGMRLKETNVVFRLPRLDYKRLPRLDHINQWGYYLKLQEWFRKQFIAASRPHKQRLDQVKAEKTIKGH